MRVRRCTSRLLLVASALLALLLTAPAGRAAASTQWPMYGHDSAHTGRSPATGPSTANRVWQRGDLPEASENGAPVVGPDGTIYVPGIVALRPDGTDRWARTDLSSNHRWTTPAIAGDGTVYIINRADGKLYALDPADGSTLWSYAIGYTTYSSPTAGPDGTIYVGAGGGNGRLYAIRPDGSLRWLWDSGSACWVESSAAVSPANGDIYVEHNCLGLVALDAGGSKKWDGRPGNTWNSPSVGADGTIYIGGSGSFTGFFALNPDGTDRWTNPSAGFGEVSNAISADGSTVYAGDGRILYAFDGATGAVRWQYDTGIDGTPSSPALSGNGIVYFTQGWTTAVGPADRGHLYALRAADGAFLWKYDIGWSGYGSPAIAADGTLYALGSTYAAGGNDPGDRAVLHAFRCADGVCDVTPPQSPSGPGTGTGGQAGPYRLPGAVAPLAFGARTLVTLSLAKRRIPAAGPVEIAVSNRNGFPIEGRLSGATVRRVAAASATLRRIRLKARALRVPAASRRMVKLALPRALRRLLARRGRLELRITARVRDPAGDARIVTRRLTPRLKGKRRLRSQ